ncbi:vitronectin a isoform X2 [Archocentrus centrarchus]|uniref:vitronectin a isoform X2 n=1 Tax=Archocentrus centrarchus TaxID=63155 RepID=UPI0011E9FA70|nr:vitronectin-like isoform X2 [Archocentrus centrarchus]
MELWGLLLLALLTNTLASDESCMGRCESGFDSQKKCQCDSMCKYYKSCCSDFEAICGMITRGDTFEFAEDDDYDELSVGTTPLPRRPALNQLKPTQLHMPDFGHSAQQHLETTLEMTRPTQRRVPDRLRASVAHTDTHTLEDPITTNAAAEATTVPIATATTVPVTTATTIAPDPDAEVCSGRPFDAFMQFKNGSIYAFRGDYFFELDQKSVIPGYPKLIKDVWGITGPIDAAFTRINCQGKTYIFKGNKYWRFDNGMLEDDYPRDISVGFDRIPDHVDAAFALPAHSHHGKEKVYFFKGDQYYVYEFLHQPSHEECIKMSESSPSTPFRRYTDVYYSNYERFFSELFSDMPQHHGNHHFINKDWKGLRSPVDAAIAGRIYISPWRSTRRRYNYQQGQQWGQRRQSRSPTWISFAEQGMNMGQEFAERGMELGLRLAERRMEMEERLGRGWDRRWDRDWDQDRRRDRYGQNNRGNYDSRDDRYRYDFQRDIPIQTVYFFKGDKYYRVDLRTKRVDPAVPPYPRSIAKYWLGCSDPTGAEK